MLDRVAQVSIVAVAVLVVAATLFTPSETPLRRLAELIRAWRDRS